MTFKPILKTILEHDTIGDLVQFREWIDKLVYAGDRSSKQILMVYESEQHYDYLVDEITDLIKSYNAPISVSVNSSSRIITIKTPFISLIITFVRWQNYERIVSLHGIHYIIVYLPKCETFLQRLLIATMP